MKLLVNGVVGREREGGEEGEFDEVQVGEQDLWGSCVGRG